VNLYLLFNLGVRDRVEMEPNQVRTDNYVAISEPAM